MENQKKYLKHEGKEGNFGKRGKTQEQGNDCKACIFCFNQANESKESFLLSKKKTFFKYWIYLYKYCNMFNIICCAVRYLTTKLYATQLL